MVLLLKSINLVEELALASFVGFIKVQIEDLSEYLLIVKNNLSEEVDSESTCAKDVACDVHGPCKWGSTEDGIEDLDDEPLSHEFSEENDEEPEVIEEVAVDLEVSPAKFATGYLVEEVHQDESIE